VVIAAIAVAAAWVLIDHPLEGPVVLTLSRDHGVHLTDVLSLVPLVWAWRVTVCD
jgi:hypothetical protein